MPIFLSSMMSSRLVRCHLMVESQRNAYFFAPQEGKNLEMLPNFAFSVPLALYLRSINIEDDEDKKVESGSGSNVKFYLLELAEKLFLEACLRFPAVVPMLFEKVLSIKEI